MKILFTILIAGLSVTAIAQEDAGITQVITPVNGSTLTLGYSYTVTVRIKNYGSTTLLNIPVQFSVGTNTSLTESYSGNLAPGNTVDFTFSSQLTITNTLVGSGFARTNVPTDMTTTNDQVSVSYVYGPPVSINEKTDKPFEIIIFPNPSSDVVHFYFKERNKIKLAIFSVEGKLVKDMCWQQVEEKSYIEVNISDIPSGIYIVKIETELVMGYWSLVIGH